jgi:hypothetical protein
LSEQDVAPVEDQVSAEEEPERMLVGFAVMETAGATLTGVCFLSSHPYPSEGSAKHMMESYIELLK